MGILTFLGRREARHGLVWLLVLAFPVLLIMQNPAQGPASWRFLGCWLGTIALAIYAHFWLLTTLLERRRLALYVGSTLALVLAGAALLMLTNSIVRVTQQNEGAAERHFSEFGQAVVNLLLPLALATVVRYVRRAVVNLYEFQQLRARQLETELSLLKAQVNQHFLFNTLNNLYGLSLAAPEQMPEALLQLAGLMRYQLDSSRQSTATVGSEAEYLSNYVGLEKLRLRANTQVEFTIDLPRPEQPVAPLLLLPLVENCFKHAIGPSGDNTIRLSLSQTDTALTLRTYNSIPPHFRPVPSGLGLPNLRARLAQFYPGTRHQLTVEATATHYTATLVLYS